MNPEEMPCYIARCLCGCGALRFAAVDEPGACQNLRDDNAKEIAALVRKGYTIERMTVSDVRSANWKCSGVSITTGQL